MLGYYILGFYIVCIIFDLLVIKFINMFIDYYYLGLLNNLNRLKIVLVIIVLMSLGVIIFVFFLVEFVIKFFFSVKYIEVVLVFIFFVINFIIVGLFWLFL